ncbi:PKD domain-containing protein, partial [Candidatus Woesearchaeota archaeon]|nr:PKD domain-containing protein [Candidatus Woesearchaeota archaeon]
MNANVSKFKKTFLALVLVINLSLMLAVTAMIVIADENVDVQPDNPLQGQALTCIASGSGPFFYYWYKDGVYQPGYSNTIPAGVTHAGEVWLCEVYIPGPPPWYEPIFYGSDFEVVRQDNDFESITVTANPSTGEEPLQVQLNCNALGGDEPITYAWDFTNDGVIDTSFNQQNSQITHTYNEGTFFARCIARDNDGDQIQGLSNAINVQCSDIDDDGVCDDDEIPFQNVIVTATPSNGVEPLQVLLTCNATGGNEPLSFAWDFTNDGIIDTDFNPLQNQVTYTYSAGDYRARCIVKDNDNDYAQALSNIIHVETQNLAPVCNLNNITILEDHDLTLNLDNYCSDPEGLPLQYQIMQAPQHLIASLFNNNLYLDPLPDWNGVDVLTLSVTDGVNVVELDVSIVVVSVNDAPVAVFNYTPSNPVVGEQVLFNACDSFDVDGDVLTFVWDFGDGVVFSTQDCVTSHAFNASQCFNVTLSVIDNVLFDVTSQQVCVSNLNHGPVCNLTNITMLEDHDLTLDLNDYCFDLDGDVFSYSIVSAPQHLIASLYGSGLYLNPLPDWNGNDSLTITISDGLQGFSLYIPITVLPVNDAPVALFSFEPLNPVVGQEVLFNASESFDVDGDVLTFVWDFGDGSSGEGVIAEHVYNETGVYHVTLIVSDDLEHSLAVQDLEVLENQPPVCNLTNITLLEDHDLTLNLDDYCFDPEGSVLTYSIVQPPQHLVVSLYGSSLYLNPLPDWNGNDSIVLSVGDGFNVVTFDVPIFVVPVDDLIVGVEASASPLSGVEPLNVTLSCFAVGGDLPLSFAWD